jgi:very-short-patch-repair endonuclease
MQPQRSTDGDRPKMRVLRLARSQHGLFEIVQAVELGLSRDAVHRLVRSKEWSAVLPRIVAITPEVDWEQRVAAACLWAGAGAAASHSTAARLWDLEGAESNRVEISVRARKSSPRPWLAVHEVTAPLTCHRRNGIPVTPASRTLIDMAGVSSEGTLEMMLEDAVRRGLTSFARLQAALNEEGGRGKPGCARLARLLADRAPDERPTESPLEARFLRVLRTQGLPTPRRQYPVALAQGRQARLDFAYPELQVAIEVDGYRWHSGRAAWQRDRQRLTALAALGWRVLHVTANDVRRGLPELRGVLEQMLSPPP